MGHIQMPTLGFLTELINKLDRLYLGHLFTFHVYLMLLMSEVDLCDVCPLYANPIFCNYFDNSFVDFG